MKIINYTLVQRGLLLNGGAKVDATIIHSPHSTKNSGKQRYAEMYRPKGGATIGTSLGRPP